jgi:hypothetical protein
MNIHTFGDSHCFIKWNPKIITHHLGPILCYSFGKEKLERCDIKKFNIKEGDCVIFSFGEIDCRCHIHKHISEIRSYQEIIDDIIYNYIEAVKENVKYINVKVGIYNVIPPVKKETVLENPVYPFLGTNEERKCYVEYFNKKLKEKCLENNFIFVDVYDKYKDKEGFLEKNLSGGDVHIGNSCFIEEFIRKNIKSDL